ncbi:MAG TPA: nucleoside triphosphate pyrophosphohydrolase [Cellvibrio sp.]|nr:nucleoside triphosphate pyrophosphohydrolase [Cellvibrio sp.]
MKEERPAHTLDDLLLLMQRLRDPVCGCPWDLKQTYETIAPSTLEEAYEVVDAIERGDYLHLKEELGDLLFQAIFYSQLAAEQNLFRFGDVVDTLVAKLIRRHPHVFPNGDLYSGKTDNALEEREVKQNWEAIKSAEREHKGLTGTLADIPRALPSLTRAAKLQKRAAQVGFDWSDVSGVMQKLTEELDELQHAMSQQTSQEIEDELGDVLFTCVNLARHLKVDPETALRKANTKFTARFDYMEKEAAQEGLTLVQLTPPELDKRWNDAKAGELKYPPNNQTVS